MTVQDALRRARQVVAATINPKMLSVSSETATGRAEDARARRASPRFDWVRPDGSVDVGLLTETKEAIEVFLSDRAILHVGRISPSSVEAGRRRELSESVVRMALDRLGARRRISEATLNAALAMFVDDVALVRRDAVVSGFLSRSPDGSSYELVGV
ncbi:DUF2087 domain-containing protein [Curtobacterium sp. MCPF17_050]|uniref:DUF2087 domain-containing protein n=1 Tax=Curtobacterium sp. MCPF17_050 TaxID=2175664 RepID=UPI000D994061|nr:DUF2087 domain-containing protein [Curtobacterium sp. MCPF17_050]WIB15902.1 DUF2087 domain-containing protein [Curtobacterium sp. MCPF17_050]